MYKRVARKIDNVAEEDWGTILTSLADGLKIRESDDQFIGDDDDICEIRSSWEENGTKEYFDKKFAKLAVPRSPIIGSIVMIWKG
ncbi:uncharacterized protein Bfra_000086 [Botrytis fragariae]|uniref:Uncharacterized protein n=1 Tax=Botrytis fragariae TaxID=1964551 RepID=A0A8H6EMP9_9HELO|nr:uncharacterized protein Bfra_000086 [Botrytis fragariae]KAF5877922.1 hypothetical protein Bfra_000086 [Botrytis fragariae]